MSDSIINVKDAAFEKTVLKNPLPVIVDFWAPWCGPCKSFAPVIGDIASDFKRSLRVAKVDTDASPALGSRFGIRSIPTIALFRAGAEIARQSGVLPKSVLSAWLGSHGVVHDAA